MHRILLICFALLLTGCGGNDTSPLEPIALADIPAALSAAFTNAEPALRQSAEEIAGSIHSGNFPAASIGLSRLFGNPGLDQPQQTLTLRAMTTVNQELQNMVNPANPDASGTPASPPPNPQQAAEAAAALQYYQSTK